MRDVAVVIDNIVQFFSVKNGLDDLASNGITFDIYVPKDERKPQEQRDACRKIKQLGYDVLRRYDGKSSYRILMEPYPEVERKPEIANLQYKYRIKYKYSLTTAKPKPVYSAKWNLCYDAILTHSLYETDILAPYAETYHIFPVKYRGAKAGSRGAKKGKKTLLYMPTFNDDENINTDKLRDALASMENDYDIALKIHQGIQYRANEKEFFEFLESLEYKKYYQDTPLDKVMESTDIVLTGNSGSIYEAMYMSKPVAIFAKDMGKYTHIVDPYHLTLVKEGVLHSTDKEEDIPNTVDKAVSGFEKQDEYARKEFIYNEDGETFLSVVRKFIERSKSRDHRYLVKKALVERHFGKRDRQIELINMYENSLSWRITKPLRVIKYNINKVIKG